MGELNPGYLLPKHSAKVQLGHNFPHTIIDPTKTPTCTRILKIVIRREALRRLHLERPNAIYRVLLIFDHRMLLRPLECLGLLTLPNIV